MTVVDSCGWLEYFSNDVNADFFEPVLLDTTHLLVPSITIFEVSRRLLTIPSGPNIDDAVALMCQGQVIDLRPEQLAEAAKSAKLYGLAMADAIIWQTAKENNAQMYTQDAAFKDLPNVHYKSKKQI